MGTSKGLANVNLFNARVLGTVKYYPAHLDNGKFVDSKCDVDVRVNSNYGTDAKGEPGRKDDFTISGWGSLADVLARGCCQGKLISAQCTPQSYSGRLFNQDGSLRLDPAGQVITVTKYSFVIGSAADLAFGEDSDRFIEYEIEHNLRPVNWNVKSHPDYRAWREYLKTRSGIFWNGQSDTFEYATVRRPQGQNIRLLSPAETIEQRKLRRAGRTNPYVPGNLQTQVANVLTTAPTTGQAWTAPNTAPAAAQVTNQAWTAPNTAQPGAMAAAAVVDY